MKHPRSGPIPKGLDVETKLLCWWARRLRLTNVEKVSRGVIFAGWAFWSLGPADDFTALRPTKPIRGAAAAPDVFIHEHEYARTVADRFAARFVELDFDRAHEKSLLRRDVGPRPRHTRHREAEPAGGLAGSAPGRRRVRRGGGPQERAGPRRARQDEDRCADRRRGHPPDHRRSPAVTTCWAATGPVPSWSSPGSISVTSSSRPPSIFRSSRS
jgi:hypothetical protein